MPEAINRITSKYEYTDKLIKQLDLDASRHSYETILRQHMRTQDNKIIVFVPAIEKISEIMELTINVFPDAHHYPVHSNMNKSML